MFNIVESMCQLFQFNLSLNVYPDEQSKCKINQ